MSAAILPSRPIEHAVVAIVCGGPSAEAGVSRRSAQAIAAALDGTCRKAIVLELDSAIGEKLRATGANVVFPALHGPPGEDGTFQGFLEILGLPYVGSGVAASARGMDKIAAKHCFRDAGLPVARDAVVSGRDNIAQAARQLGRALGPRVVVKPSRQGSALGVSFAGDETELAGALTRALDFDERALVEERIDGREVTVAVLDRFGLVALPPVEIRTPAGSWYDFEHRYTPGLSEHVIPAEIPELAYRRIREIARAAHLALGCRDLSRADFIVTPSGEPCLLEVNTLPGMTPTSLYPDAARAAGLNFETLIEHLVVTALERGLTSAAARAV